MSILGHELKKIIFFPSLIGFVVLALSLNIMMVYTTQSSYANFIAKASNTTGVHINSEFEKNISQLELGLYTDLLKAQTVKFVDVLYGYTTSYIAEIAIEHFGLSGLNERLMRQKYESFQYAVDARQQSGDGMTLYFANITYMRHQTLFNYVMGLLLYQGIILGSLIMLLSLGYENAAKTEYVVCATKIGRTVNKHKFFASVIVSIGIYASLAIVTLIAYFTLNPMGDIWNSSVSSGFNFLRDGFVTRPFVTWHSFTILQYLLASLIISLGIVLCFSLVAYAVGLWMQNSYIGFLIIIVLNSVLYLLPFYSSIMTLNFIITQSPIWLVIMRTLWFTDGGPNVIFPHFETVGIIASIAILATIAIFSTIRFNRKNLL